MHINYKLTSEDKAILGKFSTDLQAFSVKIENISAHFRSDEEKASPPNYVIKPKNLERHKLCEYFEKLHEIVMQYDKSTCELRLADVRAASTAI